MLISHILIASASIFYSAMAFIRPSNSKIYISAGLVAATLVTGTALVMSLHASLAQSCITGLVYLAVVSALIVSARYRLVHAS